MNDRKIKDLNLKQAFPPMPEHCYRALMHAACSVKEEEPMRKSSFRTIMIAVAIIILTMLAALAANELGLINFMDKLSAGLPKTATDLMTKTENKTFHIGPLQVTLRELLADGRVVLITTQANPADGSKAVLVSGSSDITDHMPESETKRFDVPEGTSFLEGARQAKTPLYIVSAYLNIDDELLNGEEMLTEFYGKDGAILQLDMLQTNPKLVQDSIEGILSLHVREMDPAILDVSKDKEWYIEEKITVPVNSAKAEKTYIPEVPAMLDGYTVTSVKAEKTVAGIYLTAMVTAGPEAKKETVRQTLYCWEYAAEDDQPFPAGISMSGYLVDDAWPVVTLHQMIGLSEFPEIMKLTDLDGASSITLK